MRIREHSDQNNGQHQGWHLALAAHRLPIRVPVFTGIATFVTLGKKTPDTTDPVRTFIIDPVCHRLCFDSPCGTRCKSTARAEKKITMASISIAQNQPTMFANLPAGRPSLGFCLRLLPPPSIQSVNGGGVSPKHFLAASGFSFVELPLHLFAEIVGMLHPILAHQPR